MIGNGEGKVIVVHNTCIPNQQHYNKISHLKQAPPESRPPARPPGKAARQGGGREGGREGGGNPTDDRPSRPGLLPSSPRMACSPFPSRGHHVAVASLKLPKLPKLPNPNRARPTALLGESSFFLGGGGGGQAPPPRGAQKNTTSKFNHTHPPA